MKFITQLFSGCLGAAIAFFAAYKLMFAILDTIPAGEYQQILKIVIGIALTVFFGGIAVWIAIAAAAIGYIFVGALFPEKKNRYGR